MQPVKSVVSSQLITVGNWHSFPSISSLLRGRAVQTSEPEKANKCRFWQVEARLEGIEVVRTRGHSKTLTVSATIAQASFKDVAMSVLLEIRWLSYKPY